MVARRCYNHAMPKVVDPHLRRVRLAEAVWRVIRREGLEGASVRAIARESELSMGSVRHYFATQSDMRIFAMQLVMDRIQARVDRVSSRRTPRRQAEAILHELLPLDTDRQAENEVWLAFTARALVDPSLQPLRDEGYDALRGICGRCVRLLITDGTRREVELETDALFALLDGLAVHAAMRPDHTDHQRLRRVLARHLDRLERR